MIPEELNKVFEKFYENELNISITKIEFLENLLTINFSLISISTEEIDAQDKRWTMQTVGHKKNKISFDKGSPKATDAICRMSAKSWWGIFQY